MELNWPSNRLDSGRANQTQRWTRVAVQWPAGRLRAKSSESATARSALDNLRQRQSEARKRVGPVLHNGTVLVPQRGGNPSQLSACGREVTEIRIECSAAAFATRGNAGNLCACAPRLAGAARGAGREFVYMRRERQWGDR